MARPRNMLAETAEEAAKRVAEARQAGEQLGLFAEAPREALPTAEARRGRGKARGASQMRLWLIERGAKRMPEDVLAELAGLMDDRSMVERAMAEAELMLAWAFEDAEVPKGGVTKPTARMRLDALASAIAAQVKAAEALMPYVAAKVTPDTGPQVQVTQIVAAAAPSPAVRGGDQARDVTPLPSRIGPPPMPHQMQQNQQVSDPSDTSSDGRDRTE